MYCDLLADWSMPTALTYFDASEHTFLVAQLTNKRCACACQMDFIPTHGDNNIVWQCPAPRGCRTWSGVHSVPKSINMANSPQCT
jgi:hypothetical protein